MISRTTEPAVPSHIDLINDENYDGLFDEEGTTASEDTELTELLLRTPSWPNCI